MDQKEAHPALIPLLAPDAFEPDNDATQAKVISSGTIQTHSIDPLGDLDWLQFTLSYTSAVLLETSGSTSADTGMRLYNSSLTELERNNDGGDGFYSKIDRLCSVDPLPPGTYYTRIHEAGMNSTISSYNLSFSSDPCIQVNPADLTLFAAAGGSNPAPKAFVISQSNAGLTPWTASANVPWLSLSRASGVISSTAPATVTVAANIAGLSQNTYSGQITINVGEPIPRLVRVTLKVGPAAPGCVGVPTDVMLVLDRSGSMAGRPFRDAQTAARAFVNQLNYIFDQMGLVSFSTGATLDQRLTKDAGALQAAIIALTSGGTTDIAGALRTAAAELASGRHNPNNPPVIVLMSDGKQEGVSGDPIAEAVQAKNNGIYIISIGLGDADTTTLKAIASSPSDYYYAPNSTALAQIFTAIAGTVGCNPNLYLPIIHK
jgi:uncharacterized protein YegL